MKYLTNSGLSYFFNKIKAYIASQLNSKASAIHTHTYSEIVDLPNGYVVDSTLDGTSSNAISNSAVSNALDGKIPKAGGAVITGTNIGRADNTGSLDICGGTTFENGGFVALHGKNTNVTGQEGAVVIGTNNGSSSCNLTLLPNGTATWGNKKIDTIEEQGDGYIRYSNGLQICWGEHLNATSENTVNINFPKAFDRKYGVGISISGQTSSIHPFGWGETWVGVGNTANAGAFTYTAIGRWK